MVVGIFIFFSVTTVNHFTSFSHANSSSFVTNPYSTYLVDGYSGDNGNETITGAVTNVSIISSTPIDLHTVFSPCVRFQQNKHSAPKLPSVPTTGNIPTSTSPACSSNFGSGLSDGIFLYGSSIVQSSVHKVFINSSWFFIAFIGNILMMLLGRCLRLHSGRSPGYAYVFRD